VKAFIWWPVMILHLIPKGIRCLPGIFGNIEVNTTMESKQWEMEGNLGQGNASINKY
jgi:hypothetical protein